MKRVCLILAALTAFSAPASAQQRGYPTCAQAQATVAARGAAVIRTAPDIYDRYVANGSFCQPTEYAKEARVPTKDAPVCFIGYVCVEGSSLDRW